MTPHLTRTDDSKEFFTNERCHILEMLNNHDTSKPFSIARARVEAKVTTAWHKLSGIVEYYYILEGAGYMEIGEEGFEVKIGDIVTIPSDKAQRIKNTTEEDLVFLAICSPPFNDINYIDCE